MSGYFKMQAKAQQKPAIIFPNSKNTARTPHHYCRSSRTQLCQHLELYSVSVPHSF